eukprot:TRINITY_DN81286_c0_g1_i1.p1 TRINITY_DN81286_c0_g1~~TRINITY_DN81286_c0_g1_i1.p1  ORF type:complete len:551 (+),score=161.07 TRINITY_DN81286_c0_g1_i1:90-1742(+)
MARRRHRQWLCRSLATAAVVAASVAGLSAWCLNGRRSLAWASNLRLVSRSCSSRLENRRLSRRPGLRAVVQEADVTSDSYGEQAPQAGFEAAAEEAAADAFLAKLQGLAAEGNIEAAEDALYDMIDEGSTPDSQHYGAIIDACAVNKDLPRAERWLFRMQRLDVVPDIHTYEALLRVALEAGSVEDAERFFQDALVADLKPELATYRLVLQTLATAGATQAIEVWVERMMTDGIKPDTASINAVIKTFAKMQNMRKAEEWLQIMSGSLGLKPDAESFNVVIEGYVEMGNVEQAERILVQDMPKNGVKPDVRSYLLLIGDGRYMRDLKSVSRWTEELRATCSELDAKAYTAIVGAWAAAGDASQAEAWFAEMMDKDIVTAEALSIVVDALVLSEDELGIDTADEWVAQVQERGVELTPAVYAALAAADVFNGDFEMVESQMQQMEADGVQMNEDSLVALLLSYANARPQQNRLAEQVFKQHMLQGRIKATRDVLEALRAAVGGARCLGLRRELQLGKPPSELSASFKRRKNYRVWESLAPPSEPEVQLAWE